MTKITIQRIHSVIKECEIEIEGPVMNPPDEAQCELILAAYNKLTPYDYAELDEFYETNVFLDECHSPGCIERSDITGYIQPD